ncbi:hypothetical protein B0H66DRAFT_539268 [Apodospora peruviana]|uniref:Zn(2)-C6 fungal-type domain-containing protein n=1 Tax=Apodospora peruviana TaxID=516989 RepID=A0AAE0IPM5_9PEZI|nr:hypothetical protein B0H66DRAFT_539268 [Apodospora peruviana]
MPPKRASEGVAESPTEGAGNGNGNPKLKIPRLDRGPMLGPEDFSNAVKSKLQSYTRTGQACDRCKVRKIRCDALPEGCSHCTNQNLECFVTDRVSGRTERRGYVQQLEREKTAMLQHMRELEQLLGNNGIEVKPWQFPGYNTAYPPGVAVNNLGQLAQDASAKDHWEQVGSLWIKNHQPKPAPLSVYTRYSLLESRSTDSYLGVSADSAPLSSIKGTTLSVLGTTIDIAAFDSADMDEPPTDTLPGTPCYNKSVGSSWQTIFRLNPPLDNVELPSRHDALTYAEWYFLMVSPFFPILHKPSFLQLLTRIYDNPSFKPSIPEMVIVHMVFATIYFQYGIRNREDPEKFNKLNELSNKHFHWSLSKFYDLAIDPTLATIQAFALLVAHSRAFPKPGCSIYLAQFAMMKALDMNVHKAVKIPGGGTTLENEIRKRVWWSILGVLVTLNGRLGRPMQLTVGDFDVEFPIAIPDEYLGEHGILDPSKIGHCEYHVGLIGFRTVPLYMEMYTNIYAIRRDPNKYRDVVLELEAGMQQIVDNLPEELRLDACKQSEQMFALYTQAISIEFTLCLRHPSVCAANDASLIAENTRICEEAAKRLLKVVTALNKMKCLDTTWYQLSVYIAAIFSTLVAHWERRHDTPASALATLREDMTMWLQIIAEIGRLLGTGPGLANEISTIIERTLKWIQRDMGSKVSSTPDQNHIQQQPSSFSHYQEMSPVDSKAHLNITSTPLSSDTPSGKSGASTAMNGNGYYDPALGGSATPYSPLDYNGQAVNATTDSSLPNGNSLVAGGPTFDPSSYTVYGPSVSPPSVEQAGSAANPLVAFASQATQHVAGEEWRTTQAQAQQMLAAPAQVGNTWDDWTAAVIDTQDRYSANALLTLGGGRPGDGGMVDGVGQGDAMGVGIGVPTSQADQWPLLIFHEANMVKQEDAAQLS